MMKWSSIGMQSSAPLITRHSLTAHPFRFNDYQNFMFKLFDVSGGQ